MSRRLLTHANRRRGISAGAAGLLLASCILPTALGVEDQGASAPGGTVTSTESVVGHLLVSEVVTGGASASDELVELYNPAPTAMPTEGLELIYVTATGATITRKALWGVGAPDVPSGGHLLIANEAGAYAPIADLTYANGLAATGGSIALRVLAASTAVDAVGWGTAASSWLEGVPMAAPAAGHSIERLPGGSAGSGQDTDQNAIDFVDRDAPDPQNSGSPPVAAGTPAPSPSGEPSPSPTVSPPAETPSPPGSSTPQPTPEPTPLPTATPSPTPSPTPIVLTVADARALPDGSQATIEGVALTDGAFTDGGGYVADASAGIAVLLSDGTFPSGVLLRATGTIDDRYYQRTLRATAADITVLGAASDPLPIQVATGDVGEPMEGQLVAISGVVSSGATQLSGGVAFDIDDGSGPIRVVAGDLTGIDTDAWERGASVALVGAVGQRDSSGTGSAGYRVQPRSPVDILSVIGPSLDTPTPSPSPTPIASPTASPTPSGSPSASPAPPLVSIAAARQADSGERLRVRGVVTLPSGLTEPGSAVVQDPSGGILIRLGDDAGLLARGELVELTGTRATKSGMLSLRVSVPPVRLGHQAEPTPIRLATGSLGEEHEALLVVTRGAIAGTLHRTSAGNMYVDLDDGSGPARVFVSPRASVATTDLLDGTWVEVVGVLGQDTTSQQPTRGYRVWPRGDADVTILAQPVAGSGSEAFGSAGAGGPSSALNGSGPVGGSGPHLSVPRLLRAVPTASPQQRIIGPALRGGAMPNAGTDGPAAAGLLVAGLLLLSTAGLAARSGLLERVRSTWLPAPSDEAADGEPDAGTRLIPLTVLDGRPADPVAPGAAPRNSGRILPPT